MPGLSAEALLWGCCALCWSSDTCAWDPSGATAGEPRVPASKSKPRMLPGRLQGLLQLRGRKGGALQGGCELPSPHCWQLPASPGSFLNDSSQRTVVQQVFWDTLCLTITGGVWALASIMRQSVGWIVFKDAPLLLWSKSWGLGHRTSQPAAADQQSLAHL